MTRFWDGRHPVTIPHHTVAGIDERALLSQEGDGRRILSAAIIVP